MPNARVILFQLIVALGLAIILPTLAVLFWQKVLVPLAKILRWKQDDTELQAKLANQILTEKKKK